MPTPSPAPSAPRGGRPGGLDARWPTVSAYTGADHLDLVAALHALRAGGGPFPPPEAGRSLAELGAWLEDEPAGHRWSTHTGGRAVGHVRLTETDPYLADVLAADGLPWRAADTAEVRALFVHPEAGPGFGAALLHTACAHAHAQGKVAVLAVLANWVPAVRLCERSGLACATSFHGVHGRTHVFVDATAPGRGRRDVRPDGGMAGGTAGSAGWSGWWVSGP